MAEMPDIEVVVFDVLGTLVDESRGLQAALRDVLSVSDDESVDRLLQVWQRHVEFEQRRVRQGQRTIRRTLRSSTR